VKAAPGGLGGGLVEVLAQQAEEITGLAQFGVEVGKLAFLAGDEFVVEHQPQIFIGQASSGTPCLAVWGLTRRFMTGSKNGNKRAYSSS
jgi:hypothetical protein